MDKPAEPVHQIKKWNVTIDEQMDYVTSKLKEKREMSFLELMVDLRDRIKIVVTFIAMLEMVKAGTVGLRESSTLNDFTIYMTENG
jgi:segregation and condensation protein A